MGLGLQVNSGRGLIWDKLKTWFSSKGPRARLGAGGAQVVCPLLSAAAASLLS